MESLVAQLLSDDSSRHSTALEACAQPSAVESVSEFARTVRSPEIGEKARERLARGLGKIPAETVITELLNLSADPDPKLRGMACVAWGERAGEQPVRELIAALSDRVNTVRNLAERSLIQQLESVQQHGVDLLLEVLDSPIPLTRSPAARLLGLTEDSRALQPLLALLDDAEWLTRMWASHALGDLGDTAACPRLNDLSLSDSKNRVRAAAVTALAKLRCDSAEATIRQAMQDTDEGVQKAAAEALQTIGLSDTTDDFDMDAFAD